MSKDTEELDKYILDAKRYRWLRGQIEGSNTAFADVYIRLPGQDWVEVQIRRGDELDTAIDSVRRNAP